MTADVPDQASEWLVECLEGTLEAAHLALEPVQALHRLRTSFGEDVLLDLDDVLLEPVEGWAEVGDHLRDDGRHHPEWAVAEALGVGLEFGTQMGEWAGRSVPHRDDRVRPTRAR